MMADMGSPSTEPHVEGAATPIPVNPHERFESFYARELRPVARLAFVLTGSTLVAEDLAQDAFFDAYRRWPTIGAYDDPGAWVRRAVANRAVSVRRRRATELAAVLRLLSRQRDHLDATGPADPIWAEVRRLPRRQAQVIALHYVDRLSTGEIATLLGISQPAVKTHLQRGRATLATRLATRSEDA